MSADLNFRLSSLLRERMLRSNYFQFHASFFIFSSKQFFLCDPEEVTFWEHQVCFIPFARFSLTGALLVTNQNYLSVYICRQPTILLYWRLFVQQSLWEECYRAVNPHLGMPLGPSCFSSFNPFPLFAFCLLFGNCLLLPPPLVFEVLMVPIWLDSAGYQPHLRECHSLPV